MEPLEPPVTPALIVVFKTNEASVNTKNGLLLLVLRDAGLSSMNFSNDSNMLNKTIQILCQILSFITYVFYTSEFLDKMWYNFI